MENQEQTSGVVAGTDNNTPATNIAATSSPTIAHLPQCLFMGRIGRMHFFLAWILVLAVSRILAFLPLGVSMTLPLNILVVVFSTALTIRRLHDVGSSGWQSLIPVAVMGGAVISLLFLAPVLALVFSVILILYYVKLFFRRGDPTANMYGEVPVGRSFVRSVFNY